MQTDFKAPSWWKPTATNDYAGAANALIPTLSSEDQRAVGTYLGENVPALASYKTAPVAPATPRITPQIAQSYLSSARASQALQGLQAAGVMSGAGYNYLSKVLNTLQRLGGNGGAITRANYQELITAVNALDTTANADTTLKPYVSLSNAIISPTFSAGPLVNQVQTQTGRTIFGAPNTKLFA